MKNRSFMRRTSLGAAHVAATAALAVAVVVLIYLVAVHPWQISWGATDAEASQVLPGDELVVAPQNQTTRAITIEASAKSVWPWLVQIGQGRGGFYSYEMLENAIGCDMKSADTILPQYQQVAIGDRVRMYPEGSGPPPYTVAEIVPGRALITGHSTDQGGVPAAVTSDTKWTETWAFILEPAGENSTRLIIRGRSTYSDPTMGAIMSVIAPGYFIMERGMLVGIKERAERAAGIDANYTAADGWNAAFLVAAFLGLAAYLFAGPWPHKLVILPIGAAMWLMSLFFGYPSTILAGVVIVAVLAGLASIRLYSRAGNKSIGLPKRLLHTEAGSGKGR